MSSVDTCFNIHVLIHLNGVVKAKLREQLVIDGRGIVLVLLLTVCFALQITRNRFKPVKRFVTQKYCDPSFMMRVPMQSRLFRVVLKLNRVV
jgi:hypothetical protein